MTEKQKMLSGRYYLPTDDELSELRLRARELTWRFNQLPPSAWEESRAVLAKLLGNAPELFFIEAPFRCDYGFNISIGDNFYANFNCVMLDCAAINIGNNVLFGPNVSIYAVGHPLHEQVRNSGAEQALPVNIGNSVWLGGGAIVNAGVTIGQGSVIGSGSVVVKSIPENVLAAGNPCRVIRPITEEDRQKGLREMASSGIPLN